MSQEGFMNSPKYGVFHEEDEGGCHVMMKIVRVSTEVENIITATQIGSMVLEKEEFVAFKRMFNNIRYIELKETEEIPLPNFGIRNVVQ